MLSNSNLPGLKWAIVYFNRFLPLFALFAGLLLLTIPAFDLGGSHIRNFVTYILFVIGSFAIKELLYQLREKIYRLGESRFFLYVILFYLSWFLNIFFMHDFGIRPAEFGGKEILDNVVIYSIKQYIDLTALVFCPAFAVIWYIFDVELDRSKRRDMDIKALLINPDDIKHWNQALVDIGSAFFSIVILMYYFPLGLLCVVTYLVLSALPKIVRQYVNLALGIVYLLLGLTFEINVINSAYAWIHYGLASGWLLMLKKQVTIAPVYHGITLIASFYYLVAAFAEIRLSKLDLRGMEKITNKKQINKSHDGEIPFGFREDTGEPVSLTVDEYNYHALYAGTTGSGKTTAILNNMEHCAKTGLPFIMLDGKGSPDLPAKIKQIADKYGRKFKLFTLKPEDINGELATCLAAYHPFSTGTFTEFKNRIMSLFSAAEGRGQQHYVIGEETAINTILAVLERSGHDFDLHTVCQFVQDITLLKELAILTKDQALIKEVDLLDEEKIGDVGKVLKLFIFSSFGHLFDTKKMEDVIKIQESIINNEIVLFMFDSSSYKEDTKKIAKLVINDINSAFSTMMGNTGSIKKCYCVFDEFASYASNNLADTLTLHRSNGMHAIVGTQGLETVSLASSETARVAEELIACCGTFLVLQLQHEGDIERLANLMGTRKAYEVTRQIDISEGEGATGMGSSKQINEYKIHPSEIRELRGKDGTGILYRKAYGQEPFKVVLRRINFK
jgi:hypothetical protein